MEDAMYRVQAKPDVLPDRKDMEVKRTLVDDVSGTKVHIGQVANCYEIVLEPPQPGPMPVINVTRINAEIFRELKGLPIPKEE